MNAHYNDRRGFFGEYFYDTPKKNYLRVVDLNGEPLAGARVELFQKDALSEIIDDTPEIIGTTNRHGRMLLPGRPVIVPVRTATGHRLRRNPFGQIFHEGSNGTMFVRAVIDTPEGPQERYGWLFIIDLSLAYWQGHRDKAQYRVIVHPPSLP